MDFSLFNMLSIGILVIDTQLKVIYINDAYANFLHKTPEELVGLHIKKVLPHTKLDEVVQSGIAQRSMWQQTEQGFLFGHRIPLYKMAKW